MSATTLLPADEARSLTLADAIQKSASGIVSRTVLQTEDLRVVLFSFAEGQELTTHTNRRRAVIHILEGACDFFHSGEWHRLVSGTLLHLPPSAPHGVRASAGSFSMLLTLGAEPTKE
jgi:quercetin dioxygenase-like cupin family protein